MSILRRRTRATAQDVPAPRPKPASAAELPHPRWVEPTDDPAHSAVTDAAATRDWPTLREALARYRADDLSELIESLCHESMAELDAWLPAALGAQHEDALARTVLGAYTVAKAWEVRTRKPAWKVSPEQLRRFRELLRLAEQYLLDAAVIDPGDSAPRYFLLVSGRGLDADTAELMHRFELVIARAPGHRGAHDQMLQGLCRKWHGSHEAMFDFARAAMRGPDAGKLGSLVAQAHIELWTYRGRDEEAYRLMRTDETRAELLNAAELSLFRPEHRSLRRPYKDANAFAAVLSIAEMWPQAWRAFEAADGVINGYWVLVDRENPYTAYVEARATALANS